MRDHPGLRSVCVDCKHPSALARFWAEALGWSVRPFDDEDIAELAAEGLTPETAQSVCVDPPDPSFPTLWFNEVPEPKVGKVRIHLDVNVADAARFDRLLEMGSHVLQPHPGGNSWTIMTDPEGNEFCAFTLDGSR